MQGNQSVHLQIATPKGVFNGSFPKTAKISEVIDAVVADRGLKTGDVFELCHDGQKLTPTTRPLVSFGLEGTVKLELIATGSGV
ncbi:MAG: hypothetical protein WD081_01930 [Gammaproteobacteria bacterium]